MKPFSLHMPATSSLFWNLILQALILFSAFAGTGPGKLMAQAEQAAKIGSPVLVIAHRGASGYLPEHSEGAKVLAYAQGADILEQDVVLTRDGIFVVAHDITMDRTTDVAEVYPDRKRDDGRYYYADFDWDELRHVSLVERSNPEVRAKLGLGGKSSRFPGSAGQRILNLEDEIKLIQGLNQTLGRNVGLHIELKGPSWHEKEFGAHPSDKLLPLLAKYGYEDSDDLCFIQCFEQGELVYLAKELKCRLPLVQLMGGRVSDVNEKVKEVAEYAQGIGPAIELCVATAEGGGMKSSGLVEAAHAVGLVVHPYTVRADALSRGFDSLDALHKMLIKDLSVDGFFTDFPDLGRTAVDSLTAH